MQYAESYQAAAAELPDDIAPEAIEAARALITDAKRDEVRYDVALLDDEAACELTGPHMAGAFAALFDGKTLADLTPDQIEAFRALERIRAKLQERFDERLDELAAEMVMDGVLRRAAA